MNEDLEPSPLMAKHGSVSIDGHKWRDITSYSQRGGESPNTWETKVGHCRIIVMRRKTGEWEAWTYSPETSRWKLDLPKDCPEVAAQDAVKIVVKWLRSLANMIDKR